MKKTILIVVAMLGPLADSAGAETFLNGRSVYGRPSTPDAATRIVDVGTAPSIRVYCGDTVTFVNGKQQFTWKFDVATHRGIALSKVAPAGFDAGDRIIYVGRQPAERGG